MALATGLSRRAADKAIIDGRVTINGQVTSVGTEVKADDKVTLDKRPITPTVKPQTIMLNKPVGYVCSRQGQGNKTIYDLLPPEWQHLKPVGRLDKDSSGLLLLTNDGKLAHELTHPSFKKEKVYEVEIDKPLKAKDHEKITKSGVNIGDDRRSQFQLQQLAISTQRSRKPLVPNFYFLVSLTEGRNRQIRRTFATLGYSVVHLHRTQFGNHSLKHLVSGKFDQINI